MKRVLVTGAAGFIGRQVTPLLREAGWEVHGTTHGNQRTDAAVAWHAVDLLDPGQRDRLVDVVRPDAVLHLAWTSRPPDYWTDPANVRWLAATMDLAHRVQQRGGGRFVGVGSCAEYDWGSGLCVERLTPLQPRTLYGTAKAAAGTVLERFGDQTGLSTAWARLFFLFGPHDSPQRLVPSLVRTLEAGQPARCATGSHARDFMHVADAAAALVALVGSPVTGPVNIGTGIALPVEAVARRVADTLGRSGLLSVDPGPVEDRLVVADVSRLRAEVGWKPDAATEQRLDEAIAWWRASPTGAPR